MTCGIIHLQVDMEQESQVDKIIVSGDLTLVNTKEVSFQIPFLTCCKETIMLLKRALNLYGRHRP
jgi:hypothetical protein